jgi:DNA topoisomerase-1
MGGGGTLVHVSDDEPGIRRRGTRRFTYEHERDGSAVRDRRTIARIRSIVIPPAWTDVWICSDPRGHIQATGRDARGRKQYRYPT